MKILKLLSILLILSVLFFPTNLLASATKLAGLSELIQRGPAIKLMNGDILLGGGSDTAAVIYHSPDNGISWTKVSDLAPGGWFNYVHGLTQLSSGKVFAITTGSNQIYSSSNGLTWQAVGSIGLIGGQETYLRSVGNRLYILVGQALFYSDDTGLNWHSIPEVLSVSASLFDVTDSNYIVAGGCNPSSLTCEIAIATHDNLVFSKTSLVAEDMKERPKVVLEKENGQILVVAENSEIWTSSDEATFQYAGQYDQQWYDELSVLSGIKHSSGLIIGGVYSYRYGFRLYRSSNDGNTFESMGINGLCIEQILEAENNTLLGFERTSFNGYYTTNIYQINPASIANAGSDQVVSDKVTLNGSQSAMPQGTIVSYQWQLKHRQNSSHDRTVEGLSPLVTDLKAGFYDVTLTITDDQGNIHSDTMELAATGAKKRVIVIPVF
jgi:hypothetical protein